MTKIIGAVFVVLGTLLFGIKLYLDYIKRIGTLVSLSGAFFMLVNEIRFCISTLPDAFMSVGIRLKADDTPVSDFFIEVSKCLKEKSEDEGLFDNAVSKLLVEGNLRECDERLLKDMLIKLGMLDADWQIKGIEQYLSELNRNIDELKNARKEMSKMYIGLGLLSGMFIVVVLA